MPQKLFYNFRKNPAERQKKTEQKTPRIS